MSLNLQISYGNGKSDYITVSPSDKIEDIKKKIPNQEDAIWKYENHILKKDKSFEFYEIEDNGIIYSNKKNTGGKNHSIII